MTTVDNHLPLTPAVFHILLALAEEPKHGYGIMQDVEEMTDGQVTMGPGTLYGAVKRLLRDNLIEEVDNPPDADDKRRKYYALTAFGERVLRAEVARMQALVDAAAHKRLTGGA